MTEKAKTKACKGFPARGIKAHRTAVANFNNDKRRADGLARVCRACRAAYRKARRAGFPAGKVAVEKAPRKAPRKAARKVTKKAAPRKRAEKAAPAE